MAREPLEAIKPYRAGEELTVGTVNALLDAAKLRHAPQYGTYEAGGSQRQAADDIWIKAVSAIPAYSVIGVCLSSVWHDPPYSSGAQIGSGAGSIIALYTNDAVPIPPAGSAAVRPIGFDPVLVNVVGTTIAVGQPCGPCPDDWGVSGLRQGFVCLSEPNADGRIWIARSNDLSHVVGEVTLEAPAFDVGTDMPGYGELKVQFRSPVDDALVDAKSPTTGVAPWTLPFYNLSSVAVPVDSKVRAESALGVGLTVLESSGSSGIISSLVRLVGSGGYTVGDLVAAASGYHSGIRMSWVDGVKTAGSGCLMRFVDWDDDDTGDVIGEYYRIYGPMISGGTLSGTTLFVGEIGEQTFLAKYTADVAIGVSANFKLYNRDETDSGIVKNAKCVANAYVANRWAIVTRLRGGEWVASPWACQS